MTKEVDLTRMIEEETNKRISQYYDFKPGTMECAVRPFTTKDAWPAIFLAAIMVVLFLWGAVGLFPPIFPVDTLLLPIHAGCAVAARVRHAKTTRATASGWTNRTFFRLEDNTMAKQTTAEMVREEVVKTRMPTLPNERVLGMGEMIMIQVSFSVATWMLVLGAWTGMATPLPLAIIACMVGCSLPLLFHNLIGPFVTRWGLDNGIITNSVAGPVGTLLIVILVTTPHVPRIHLGAHCHVRTYRA